MIINRFVDDYQNTWKAPPLEILPQALPGVRQNVIRDELDPIHTYVRLGKNPALWSRGPLGRAKALHKASPRARASGASLFRSVE
jgi:hypothetical protein